MKKEYIKTNLIGFIIAGIIVSGVVVCAAVTFPSNEVSYSNTESGLNSNNVQGAIDELYETCTALTTGEQIIEDNGLEKDPYECRYFFTGATPNNYITFNNEPWRIISVECDGTIKIMRNESIGNMAWDTSNFNNWERPASLNTYLNETYYNYLTSEVQSQIVSKDWSIGTIAAYGSSISDNLSNQINDENSIKWNGKVALITVSEYIRTNSNQSGCGTLKNTNNNWCRDTTWMTNNNYYWWTLTSPKDVSTAVLTIHTDGRVYYGGTNSTEYGESVRPSVYLSSDIQITGGNGTSSDPYRIE